jgi:integrase
MGATYQRRGKAWRVTVHWQGQRERKTVRTEADAKALVQHIHKQELAGINVVEAIRAARAAVAPVVVPTFPTLRDGLTAWVTRLEQTGEIRASSAGCYRSRLGKWVFPHQLKDGRVLGDVPTNLVTREMIGAVIWRAKEAGRSLAIIGAIRHPIKSYYQSLVETKQLAANPAADLRYFIGKRLHRKRSVVVFFAQEEGPQLIATAKALWPRWAPFILTGLVAGLRWGESAALYRSDIDWQHGRLHVQRSFSPKGGRIEACKNGKDRWVKASPALLAALREHLAAMDLEGQGWSPAQRQLVFPSPTGRFASHMHFLSRVWRPLLSKAGLPYRKYHSTRHTFGTWLLTEGADMRWVQQQMGHASISQTADTYGHVQPDRHEGIIGTLDKYLL